MPRVAQQYGRGHAHPPGGVAEVNPLLPRSPLAPCSRVTSMKVLTQRVLGGNHRPLWNQEMIAWLPPSPDRIEEQ